MFTKIYTKRDKKREKRIHSEKSHLSFDLVVIVERLCRQQGLFSTHGSVALRKSQIKSMFLCFVHFAPHKMLLPVCHINQWLNRMKHVDDNNKAMSETKKRPELVFKT